MIKRIYGPDISEVDVDSNMPFTSWKVVSIPEEDGSVSSILLVKLAGFSMVSPMCMERWMTEVSWGNISRDHLRWDKVYLFVGFLNMGRFVWLLVFRLDLFYLDVSLAPLYEFLVTLCSGYHREMVLVSIVVGFIILAF